jgi:His/Glu/Gln/Arg/opine family amino acid ABC transporter permease subunit
MPYFDVGVALDNLGRLGEGLGFTVLLTVIVMALSLVVALLVALGRMSRLAVLRWPMTAYVEVIRNTPLLLQLYYFFFVLPYVGIKLDGFTAAVLALTLNCSAYMSEVYRSGIQAIAKGQHDAAHALGMTFLQTLRRIVLPQAIRIVIPWARQLFHLLVQGLALCSIAGVAEVMFTAKTITAVNYQYFTIYRLLRVLFHHVAFPAARFVNYLERTMKGGYARRRAGAWLRRIPDR